MAANSFESISAFMDLPKCEVHIPNNPILSAALEYIEAHTSPTTVNHCMRSAAYALLCIRKTPQISRASTELVLLSCMFHDLGWATTSSLISEDKRFEVDGANAARAWIQEHQPGLSWDERQIQLCWDAIALHSTPSIALHKQAEVVAVNLGITADFLGAGMPGDIITVQQQLEISQTFPRLGLHDEIVSIMCGICRHKPETTFDNFVSGFGVKYGYDGKGEGKEEFAAKVEENLIANKLMGALKVCERSEEMAMDLQAFRS